MRCARVIGIAAAVALALGGCGAQPVAGVHAGPSAGSTGQADDRPRVSEDLFQEPWVLDDGALRVDPVTTGSSPHTRADAVLAMQTSQREFYIRSLGQQSSGTIQDVGAGYGLVSLDADVRVGADDSGEAAPVMPSPADYQRRPAWVVWFRVTGAWGSCPLKGSDATRPRVPDSVRSHAGWHVLVYPDRLDAALSYLETQPAICGGVEGGSATVAWQHVGAAWRVVTRTGGKATVAYTPPPCARFDGAGGSGGPDWSTTIVLAVPFGPAPCPSQAEQTLTLDVPAGASLTAGQTGVLTGEGG